MRIDVHEVGMAGRRSHPRFTVASPWEGALRVMRAVVANRTSDGELLAVSHVPAIVGEEMSLDLLGGGETVTLSVRVLESAPVIVNGAVRHKVRLALLEGAAEEPETPALPVAADGVEAV